MQSSSRAHRKPFIGELLRHAEAAAPMASPVPSSKTTGLVYCENALEAIGHTPLGEAQQGRRRRGLSRACKDRVRQSRRKRQRPPCRRNARRRRAPRLAQAGRHDRRADERQYRHGPGNGGGDSGIPVHPRHARQDVARKDRPFARLRRRRRHYADQRSSGLPRIVLRRGKSARVRNPGSLSAESVSQSLQSRSALSYDRPGNLGADRRRRSRISWPASGRAVRSPARPAISKRRIRQFTSSVPTPKARSTRATFRVRMRSKGLE